MKFVEDYKKSLELDKRIQKILEGFGYELDIRNHWTTVYTSEHNEITFEDCDYKTIVILEKYGEYNADEEKFELLQQYMFDFTTLEDLIKNIVEEGYIIEY